MSVSIATATGRLSRIACSCLKLDRKGFQTRTGSVIPWTAPWWWWKARPLQSLSRDPSPCSSSTFFLNIVGLGICWALFALTTHALPFFVGITAGIYSFQAGADPFGAIVVGFVRPSTSVKPPVGTQSPSRARPLSALSLGYYSRFRRHAPVTLALAHQYSFGMVAAVVSYAWRRRRREHRLGARVDPDRPRSETGRCVRPNPTTDWGGDQGQVTLRVYRLSVGISGMSGRLILPRHRAVLSHTSIEPGDLLGRPGSGVSLRLRCLLSARRHVATFLHTRLTFPSPGTRGLLCGRSLALQLLF
jgi:hypothetical protein